MSTDRERALEAQVAMLHETLTRICLEDRGWAATPSVADALRATAPTASAFVARVRGEALDAFTVWLLRTHGLLIDEALLNALKGKEGT